MTIWLADACQVIRVGRAHGVTIPDFFGIELDRMVAAADGDLAVGDQNRSSD
jgi:hypothetical protein